MYTDKMRYYREKAGKTQQQMADALGVTKSAYCHYENGKRKITIDTAVEISKILKRPLQRIFLP